MASPEVNVRLKRRRLEVQIITLRSTIAHQELEIMELEDQIGQKRLNIESSRDAIIALEAQLAQFPPAEA
jgi:uncharacterized coiled-coil protein SlyX